MRPLLVAALLCVLGCASGHATRHPDNYLRYVSFDVPLHEHVLLRWRKRDMPLKVYLPFPKSYQFKDPQAVYDVVRDGVLDWSDVAAPGIPSFTFVDTAREADIPIFWEKESKGWFIAYCSYDIHEAARRFGVDRILVTAREADGREARLDDVYSTVLHEMGHALGLGGHSPDPGDVMYPWIVKRQKLTQLSPRDRETLRLLYQRPVGKRISSPRSAD